MNRHRRARSFSALLRALVLTLALTLRPCLAVALQARAAKIPPPISVAPDQDWMGIDGSWNTITLRSGSPDQINRVIVSTASQQTWLIDNSACMEKGTENSACFDGRGRTFNKNASTSWRDNGFFQLWTEKNLGLGGNGFYGWETIGLGGKGEETATLKNTTVGTIISPNFWLGHLGINPKPTNFSAFTDPSPSYTTLLFEQKQIPSLSFGYTAGNKYHDTIVLSSLTLGGFDSSRIIPNDLTFGFAPDNERDIVVGVVGIKASSTTKTNVSLFGQDSFTMYIDSTVAELWLPKVVCEAFEKTFGLKYDETTSLYLVDDLLHETLKAENPSITFSLGQKFTTNTTIDITLPYSAFDLQASAPYRGINATRKYFPIRRGEKEEQFVLGRTFLQEAYLHVDWERQNFSVYAVDWTYKPKNIVPYYSPQYGASTLRPTKKSKPLGTGAIIGVALGVGFGVALLICGTVWWFWRRRQQQKLEAIKEAYAAQAAAVAEKKDGNESSEKRSSSHASDPVKGTNVIPKAELPAEHTQRDPSTPTTLGLPSPLVEAENTERQVFEMPGDIPTSVEAGGRQLSEKETMIVREARINGVDPNSAPATTPTSEEPQRRLAPVSADDVAIVNRRLPVSPMRPRAPRDGASLEANDSFFQPRTPRDGRYMEAEDSLLSPISPMEGSDGSRRRFSYEI
ncbi:acid protease [Byssothecium circinans]|uniref:Acid protease n=1 Tax=Byssothecium circinans TaxID=147558 RepID=A0A6A5TEJ5_9PLEO|nr:acid protease [Byssothecium circinans]